MQTTHKLYTFSQLFEKVKKSPKSSTLQYWLKKGRVNKVENKYQIVDYDYFRLKPTEERPLIFGEGSWLGSDSEPKKIEFDRPEYQVIFDLWYYAFKDHYNEKYELKTTDPTHLEKLYNNIGLPEVLKEYFAYYLEAHTLPNKATLGNVANATEWKKFKNSPLYKKRSKEQRLQELFIKHGMPELTPSTFKVRVLQRTDPKEILSKLDTIRQEYLQCTK